MCDEVRESSVVLDEKENLRSEPKLQDLRPNLPAARRPTVFMGH